MVSRFSAATQTSRGRHSTGRLFSRRRLRESPSRLVAPLIVGLLLASGVVTTTPAAAEPLSVPLATMGQNESIEFDARSVSKTLTLSVPDGLTPSALTGAIEVSTHQSSSILAIYDDTTSERLLSIRLDGSAGKTVPLEVSLTKVTVEDRALSLRFEMSLPERCELGTRQPTTLRDLSLTYSGSESAPATIATFLPPILSGLTIYLPDKPDADVRSAAVSLASAIAARYNPAQPRIRVTSVPGGDWVESSATFTRSIQFTGTGEAGLSVNAGSRLMSIAGKGRGLRAQIDALSNNLATVALATRAVATRPQDKPALAPATQTLSDLGLGNLTADGSGSATITLGVEAAAFGGPATSWGVHLVGTVSTGARPSSSNSRGTLTATVGDDVLNSWPIPEDGRFDVTATIPGDLLSRYTALKIDAVVNGAGGCESGPPTRLTLDPRSTIEAKIAPLPTSGDFTDFPAVLSPSYQLAVDGTDLTAVQRAVAMAVSLQHLVRVRLDPQLVGVPDVVGSSSPGVLIIGGALPDGITLPLSSKGDTVTLPDGSTLTADAAMATAQVVATDQRTLLVVSGTRPPLVKGLARRLSDPDQLAQLSGGIAIWSGDGAITSLQGRIPATQPTDEATSPLDVQSSVIVAVAVGVALLIAGAIAATMIFRRRRGGSPGRMRSHSDSENNP